MQGLLIVNGYLKSEKFEDLYSLFLSAAEKRGVSLIKKSTVDLLTPLGDYVFAGKNGVLKPDFAIFWDKDVTFARRLQNCGVRCFNSSNAVELCDNKILTYSALSGTVKIPKTLVAPKTFEGVGYSQDFLQKAADIIGFPMVVKQAYGSFGKQVYLVRNFESLKKTVNEIGWRDFLIQEFIQSSVGRDMRVNVCGVEVCASMLRFNDSDFRSNISNGGSMKKFDISNEWSAAAIKACEVLGLDFAGVDVMFGADGEPVVCEVNSNPHFRSTLECTGVDMSERIIDLIISKLKK